MLTSMLTKSTVNGSTSSQLGPRVGGVVRLTGGAHVSAPSLQEKKRACVATGPKVLGDSVRPVFSFSQLGGQALAAHPLLLLFFFFFSFVSLTALAHMGGLLLPSLTRRSHVSVLVGSAAAWASRCGWFLCGLVCVRAWVRPGCDACARAMRRDAATTRQAVRGRGGGKLRRQGEVRRRRCPRPRWLGSSTMWPRRGLSAAVPRSRRWNMPAAVNLGSLGRPLRVRAHGAHMAEPGIDPWRRCAENRDTARWRGRERVKAGSRGSTPEPKAWPLSLWRS